MFEVECRRIRLVDVYRKLLPDTERRHQIRPSFIWWCLEQNGGPSLPLPFHMSRRHGSVRIMHHHDVTISPRVQDKLKTSVPAYLNALRLYFKDQEVNVLPRNNRCVFWQPYETHKICYMNNNYRFPLFNRVVQIVALCFAVNGWVRCVLLGKQGTSMLAVSLQVCQSSSKILSGRE
jgi:hypothetical protein